jgi:hypothetical protein
MVGWLFRQTGRPASDVSVRTDQAKCRQQRHNRSWNLPYTVGRKIRRQRARMDGPTIEDQGNRRAVCSVDTSSRPGRSFGNGSELSHAPIRSRDGLLIGRGSSSIATAGNTLHVGLGGPGLATAMVCDSGRRRAAPRSETADWACRIDLERILNFAHETGRLRRRRPEGHHRKLLKTGLLHRSRTPSLTSARMGDANLET